MCVRVCVWCEGGGRWGWDPQAGWISRGSEEAAADEGEGGGGRAASADMTMAGVSSATGGGDTGRGGGWVVAAELTAADTGLRAYTRLWALAPPAHAWEGHPSPSGKAVPHVGRPSLTHASEGHPSPGQQASHGVWISPRLAARLHLAHSSTPVRLLAHPLITLVRTSSSFYCRPYCLFSHVRPLLASLPSAP